MVKLSINGKTYESIRGKTLLDVFNIHGIVVSQECQGKCTCGTCLVKILEGSENLSAIRPNESEHLTADKGKNREGCRLACQSVILGPVSVQT